jgi:hypothetical protein
MNTDPDHLHYLTATTPAAEGGVGQPALAVKDRGERSVCRKVPSIADSSAEHGSVLGRVLNPQFHPPRANKGGTKELKYGKILRLLSQTYWLNGREPIIIIILSGEELGYMKGSPSLYLTLFQTFADVSTILHNIV